ncbi:MAG TPA: tetratricopeptide repeat protein [Pseudomonadales bacterium]|nr:tetratricopeptide repeat protein [Pseudomonadales bacterium]
MKSLNFATFGPALLALVLLGGCATTRQIEAPATEKTGTAPAAADNEASAEETPPEPSPEEYPVKPFSKEVLYELLVGEIAGYRGDFNLALDNYLKATQQTRDPGVAARTTRLAAYLKHDDIALKAARVWSEVAPTDMDAHRYAADLMMRAGEVEDAVKQLEAIKRLGGSADFPMFAYRAANLSNADRDRLLKAWSHLTDEYPDDDQLKFSRAVLLEQNGQQEDALAIANQLLAEKPDLNVVILKVNALKSLHRDKEAIRFLQRTIKEMKGNRRLRLIYARLLFENDKLGEARAQYEAVNKQSPGDGDILFALALISLEQSDDQAARTYLEEMVKDKQRVGEAHYYLGNLAEKEKDAAAALKEYKQVTNGYEFLPAQSRIANLLFDEGKRQQALDWLETARGQFPERYDQLIVVEAQLLSDHGLGDQALAFLDQAIANDPGNTDLLYFRAMTGEKFGRLDILERDLKKIIKLDPNNADALNALGYTLTDQTNRHQEALKLIQKALEIKPNEPAFIDSLGWVMYRLKHYDEAVTELKRALKMFPNDEVAAHLGEVLWVTGKKAEANKVWQEGLHRKPDSEVLKKVIQKFTGQ